MTERRLEFGKEMGIALEPKLKALGFHRVVLNGCIHPEVLFNRGRLWFGSSWDSRDRYLELELGHLFWFKDVMPRVVVLGDYANHGPQIEALAQEADLKKISEFARDTVESAIEDYGRRYGAQLAARKNPEDPKYQEEFLRHLGREVAKDELSAFMA